MKTVYILIGAKGSGKTYIGQLIEKELSIFFLEVEALFLIIKNEKNNSYSEYIQSAYNLVKKEILENLAFKNEVIFESTGIATEFKELVKDLKNKNIIVRFINIIAPLGVCSKRIKSRNQAKHIPLSDEVIESINHQAIKQDYIYDLKISNLNISDQEIIDLFRQVIIE